MNDVYRDVPDLRRLLPRERDVLTGQRTGRRDDKRRDEQQPRRVDEPVARGALGTSLSAGMLGVLVAVALVVLAGAGFGVRALVADDEPVRAANAGATLAGSTGAAAPVTDSSPTEPPASAIELEYVGGKFVRHECSDASGKGQCSYYDYPYSPLTVRCTPTGCTLFHFATLKIDGPVRATGSTPAQNDGCQPTRWTLQFTPIGQEVTEGIKHPARIVGTATSSRPAEVVPGSNCLGAVDEYRYDAIPD